MTSTPDRRTLISETALDIVARDGLRALTHRAVDRELGLPDGSSSYYFRTRAALIDAATHRITANSHEAFARSELTAPTYPVDIDDAARSIATALDDTLRHRRRDILARYALATDPAVETESHRLLAHSLFSTNAARTLTDALGADTPETAAADFVALCEGLVADRIIGPRSLDGPTPGTPNSIEQLARPLAAYLRGLLEHPSGTPQP